MSPDVIIGIAVLFEDEGIEHLMVRMQCGNGTLHTSSIPVYPKGGTKIREHQWEYTIQGDTLHVRPSVNWVGVFHNDGAWSVKFVRFDSSQWQHPGDQFRHLNGIQ